MIDLSFHCRTMKYFIMDLIMKIEICLKLHNWKCFLIFRQTATEELSTYYYNEGKSKEEIVSRVW